MAFEDVLGTNLVCFLVSAVLLAVVFHPSTFELTNAQWVKAVNYPLVEGSTPTLTGLVVHGALASLVLLVAFGLVYSKLGLCGHVVLNY